MPTPRVCYLEVPARDVQASAEFYAAVFGWQIRTRGDGAVAFDDGGVVSGAFVTGRPSHTDPGLVVYVMVDDAEDAVGRISSHGGTILRPIGHSPERIAWFSDPAGNVLGVYQEPE